MRSLFGLWAFVLATPGQTSNVFSSPTAQNDKVAEDLPDDAEMLPPMEPYESVDLDVDEEADREGTFQQHSPHSHPVLVHPSGPGGQHSRKSNEKPKTKKVATAVAKKDPAKDPNPMNTLHQNIKAFHNNGIRNFEKDVDSAKVDQSASTHGKSPEPAHRRPEVKVQHHPSQPQASKPRKPEPVVQRATASPIKPAKASPASPVSHEVPHKKGNAPEARDTVAPDAPISKATVNKLSQALAPPKAQAPEPESDVVYEPVHHKGSGKHMKKHKVQDSSIKKVVTQTTAAPTTAPQVQKHPDLQSQVAELDADLQDDKHIASIPANVEANLESKLDTEDEQKAADKSSEEIPPPKMKQHGKHKHAKGKKKAETTEPEQTRVATHEDPLDQLHSDVHPRTTEPEIVQQASVTPTPQVTEAEAKTKENGSDKLRSDTSGETVVSISKKLAKAVESKLEKALQPPAKPQPQPVDKVMEPPAHHAHGKKHKKHSQHQDVTPAWSHNSTNGDAIKALHKDTHQYPANVNKSQSKPAPSAAPVQAAKVSHVAPEEKLRKDLGINSVPAPTKPVVQAAVPPPAVHTLVHKSHKHHKGKSKFMVGNVTYKDPMAAVHHDAAAVSAQVKPPDANQASNKTQSASLKNASNKSIAPLAKLDKDLGVNTSDAQKRSDAKKSSHLGHPGDDAHGKHHNFLKKKKKEQKVEPPAPTEKPPYNVSLMHHALEHLDHAIESQERSYMAATDKVFHHKPHIVDEDRPEGYPTL